MSLSDIFNFFAEIFKFIWNLNLIWVLIFIAIILLISFALSLISKIVEFFETIYENNPNFAFITRWTVFIIILSVFLFAIAIVSGSFS